MFPHVEAPSNEHKLGHITCAAHGDGVLRLTLHADAGAVFIQIMQQQLDKFGDVKFESLTGANARKTVLVIGIMAAHAVGEGCGVGVSFCGSRGWAQVRFDTRQAQKQKK